MADKTSLTTPTDPLPDGRDESDYAGHERWTMRQWAWEFLRRNEEFIAACREVAADDTAGRAEIAMQFGLKKFQHFAAPYNRERPVKFLASHITYRANVDSQEPKTLPAVATRPLAKGEVLIRFDVSTTTTDGDALKAQIRAAGLVLRKRRAAMLKGVEDSESKEKRTSHPDVYRRYLRVLDLTRAGLSQAEALRVLNADHDLVSDPEVKNWEVRDNLKSQLVAARKLVLYKYLALAISRKYKGSAKKKG